MKTQKKNLIPLLGILFLALLSFSGKAWAQPVALPSILNFENTTVGIKSRPQSAFLLSGSQTAFNYNYTLSGDFSVDSQNSSCTPGGTIPAPVQGQIIGPGCTLDILFSPNVVGPRYGNLQFSYSDANGQIHTLDIILTGVGDAPLTLSPQPSPPALIPIVCGNGTQEQGEVCDDGNLMSGDGCSSTCTLENNVPATPAIATPVVTPSPQVSSNEDSSEILKMGGGGCSMGNSASGMGSILGYAMTLAFVGILRQRRSKP